MDEECSEWQSLLRAVKHKLSQPRNSLFVVAELSARYGTWTVRAGAAMRTLQPFRPVQLLAVEADQSGFMWLQEHVCLNGLGHATQAIRGSASEGQHQSVSIRVSATEGQHQRVSIRASASEDQHQKVSIRGSASEREHQSVSIRVSASERQHQGVSTRAPASGR